MPSDNLLIRTFTRINPYDQISTPIIDDNGKQTETGMDRLKQIFLPDQFGYQSKELAMITQLSGMSAFASFIIGGIMKSRGTYVNFIENNQATQFVNHLDAKRKLQREMYLSFMKGGWYLSWRVGMFSLTFSSLMTGISTYRGKDSLLEYVVAGGVTGGLFKMNLGLKGMVAGSAVGIVLGTLGGAFSMLTLKLGAVSMKDVRDFSKLLNDARQDAIAETRKKYILEELDIAKKEGEEKDLSNLKIEEETTKTQPA